MTDTGLNITSSLLKTVYTKSQITLAEQWKAIHTCSHPHQH